MSAREAAERLGISERTVRRLVAQSRDDYLDEQRERREAIRAHHDDAGHSWSETADHFGVTVDTVKRLGYRARRERAEERADAERAERERREPPLFEV